MSQELTTESLRDAFKRNVAEAAVSMLPLYLLDLKASEDPEDKRKFLALAAEVNGWKDVPQKNPLDNLPVFNFNFSGGHVEVVTTMPDGTQHTVDVHSQPEAAPAPVPVQEVVEVEALPPPGPPVEVVMAGEVIDLDALLADDD